MSKHLNVHIIERARALIADEAHWCRRQIALDSDGMAVCATDSRASKLCAFGALVASARHLTNDCDQSYRLARGDAIWRQYCAHLGQRCRWPRCCHRIQKRS